MKTKRGFKVYKSFKDSRNRNFVVQEGEQNHHPRCWIFLKDVGGAHITSMRQTFSPFMTVDQARKVVNGLKKFIREHGK